MQREEIALRIDDGELVLSLDDAGQDVHERAALDEVREQEPREQRDAETTDGGLAEQPEVVRGERAVHVQGAAADRPRGLRELAAREAGQTAVVSQILRRARRALLGEVAGRGDGDRLVAADGASDEPRLDLGRGAQRDVVAVAEEVDDASIDTGNSQRDDHLRTGDFFDAPSHPKITFKSTRIEPKGESEYVVHGDLTMRGVTKPVALDVELHGTSKNPWGKTVAGLSARATINRKDFGVSYNAVLDAGGVAVGEKVKIEIDAELVAPEAAA